MVDVASVLFMAGGALTYPLFFHLSLKKSLSLVSREKVANGRVLLSLIILYLETVALVILSTPLSFIQPSSFPPARSFVKEIMDYQKLDQIGE